MSESSDALEPDLAALRAAISSGDPVRAMPALTQLRFVGDDEAVPLLVLGTEQKPFLVRSLSCSGLGYKRNEQGWTVLSALITADEDPNVRAEAANALASYGVERAWPLLCRRSPLTTPGWCVAAFFLPWRNSRRLSSPGCWSLRKWRLRTPMAPSGWWGRSPWSAGA